MTTGTQQRQTTRWVLVFLAAFVTVLATAFGTGVASAATDVGAQTRVGASTVAVQHLAGLTDRIGAGQRLGNGPPRVVATVATGVAAESGASLIKAGSEGGESAGKAFSQSVPSAGAR